MEFTARGDFAHEVFGELTKYAIAELTLFSRTGNSTLTESNNLSKSFNTPFANKQLNGNIIGTINKGILSLNQTI